MSRRITRTPREASHSAMPEPITPAPTTMARSIGGNFGAFRLARLARSWKKSRIRFLHVSLAARSSTRLRSRASEADSGERGEASTTSAASVRAG